MQFCFNTKQLIYDLCTYLDNYIYHKTKYPRLLGMNYIQKQTTTVGVGVGGGQGELTTTVGG